MTPIAREFSQQEREVAEKQLVSRVENLVNDLSHEILGSDEWAALICMDLQLELNHLTAQVEKARALMVDYENFRAGRKFCFPDFDRVTKWLTANPVQPKEKL